MKIKPLQAVILVAGAVAAIAALWWSFGRADQVRLADSVTLVDVQTGQLYQASVRRRTIMQPAAPPDGGEPRLVIVEKDPSGKWFLTPRSFALLRDLPVDSAKVDPETGEVLAPSRDIRPYDSR